MSRKFFFALILCTAGAALAQDRPGLFFREDFKETPAATPITQDHIANPDLILNLYGPGKSGVKKSHHDKPADDPYYVWSGTAPAKWALTLRHKTSDVNLTGLAKLRWRSKQAGFREARIILKLAGGMWLIGDEADGPSVDWREREFNFGDIRWRKFDIRNIVEGAWVEKPDLSRVEEIGFTDLSSGGESNSCTRLDWIEVYGKPVKRQ